MKCNHKNKSKARQKLTQIILPTILLCTSSRIASKTVFPLKVYNVLSQNIICLWLNRGRIRLLGNDTWLIINSLLRGGMCCMFLGSKVKMGFMLLAPGKKSIRTLLLGTPQTLHLKQDRQGTWRSHPDIFLSVFIFLYKTCSLPRIHFCLVTQRSSSVAWRDKKGQKTAGREINLFAKKN